MIIIILLILLWWGSGGFDVWSDLILNESIKQYLENSNDIILNNLFQELFGLVTKEEYLNFLYKLEEIYNINLNNVNDMTWEVQEKIKKDLIIFINELKQK